MSRTWRIGEVAERTGLTRRTLRQLDNEEMLALARGQVTGRLEDAAQLREHGQVDKALMLEAEALVLSDRLDAFTSNAP